MEVKFVMEDTMKKAMLLVLFVFAAGLSFSQEYDVGSMTFYNGDGNSYQGKIVYAPGPSNDGFIKNLVLPTNDGFPGSLIFGSRSDGSGDMKTDLVAALDKSIEWAEIAHKNNVTDLTKKILDSAAMAATGTPRVLYYVFAIQDIKGKKEPFLTINFKTVEQANDGFSGGFLVIRGEDDFKKLKQLISPDNLAKYDKQYAINQKKSELFK
jgi:hypothetical protein